VFFTAGGGWLYDLLSPFRNALLFAWLFLVMLGLSFRVVHHADALGPPQLTAYPCGVCRVSGSA